MIYPIWRLSEYAPDNLGLAFTHAGLLLGRTPLIERRDGRFVVRELSEIARLVKYSFPDGVAVDRLMPGLARIAAALNANDRASARIAAVHLQIPDLPGLAARNAMVAEDALIKYARDAGGGANWNPALHPRVGVAPNPGWFATTGGHQQEPGQHEPGNQSRLRVAANEDGSHLTDVPAIGRQSGTGSRRRCPNMTSRTVRRWASGRAGEPLHLTLGLRSQLRRCSGSTRLRQRSQHGLGWMLQKRRSSRMLYVAPRQKRGY
jgi:hypothetical protein